MYKALGIIFCTVLILFCSPNGDFVGSFVQNLGGQVYFCVSERVDLPNVGITKNGKGYIISAEQEQNRKIQNSIQKDKIQGIAFRFNGNFDTQSYLRKISAEIIFDEKIDEITFIYAYSSKFSRFVMYRGRKINIQIAQNSGETTIGYPLILIGA